VTHASAKPPSTNRYRLRTFGTLALAGPGDQTLLGKDAHQHRRLALIAVLAAAGERGRSRDQLLLLFWPAATQARARHSLEQLLYAIRSSIDEGVFAGVNPVRLNPDVVGSDLADFQDALERNDLEGAVNEYGGAFLDGLYLSDTPEFQQWLDTERARLERSYCDALERLAQKADAAPDHAAAVRWWRKLADTDPVSSKNAVGLIRALMNAVDHAAALQFAERYEAIMARELGTSVGPAVAEIVAEVRSKIISGAQGTMRLAAVPPRPKEHTEPVLDAAIEIDRPRERITRRRLSPLYAIGVGVIIATIATLVMEPLMGHATDPKA